MAGHVLREIFVKLGLDVNAASFGVGAKLTEKLVDTAAEAIKEVIKFPAEMAHAFVELVEHTAEGAHELELLSQRTGATTEDLQKLSYAASVTGVGADTLSTGMNFLARSMTKAKSGTGPAADAFHKLGIRVTDVHGKLRPATDIIGEAADKLATMEDGMDKAALSAAVFGRSAGPGMIPLLNKGKEGIDELAKSAVILTEEQIKAGSEIAITAKRIDAAWGAMLKSAIAPLLPALAELSKRWLKLKKEVLAFMKPIVAKVFDAIVWGAEKFISVLEFLWKNISIIGTALAGLAIYFALVNAAAIGAAVSFAAAWIAAAAPLLLIAGLVAGLLLVIDDIRGSLTGEYKNSVFNKFRKAVADFMSTDYSGSPFIQSIQSILKFIERSIEAIKRFGKTVKEVLGKAIEYTVGSTETEGKYTADDMSGVYRRPKGPFRLPMSNAPPLAAMESYAPPGAYTPMSTSRPSAVPVTVNQSNQYTVHAAEGMDEKQIAEMIDAKQKASWDDALESAAAAQSR